MKRIWIAGSAGSGKTNIANIMGEKLNIPVYHRDYITWDKDSNKQRAEDEQIVITKNVTQTSKWIFEGARFSASKIDGRLDKCDTIIHLSINRFTCLYRAIKRAWQKSRNNDLIEIDRQPFCYELFKYILFDYPRKHKQRSEIFEIAKSKGINVIIIRNSKEIIRFLENI